MHTPRTRATEKGGAMKNPKPKPFISIDFDGVLNNYQGYDGDNLGTPRPGAKEFLEKLSKKYRVIILTARRFDKVMEWLNQYELSKYVFDVTSIKPKNVVCFVDDRAIKFNGEYAEVLRHINNFKTYWEE